MKNRILSFFVVLISCTNEDITKQISVESKIVVEGSIEEGGFAKVLLSRSVPIGVAVDSTTILNYVIRSAKVTVSDGKKEDPVSTQPYLLTSPLKNSARLVPFSQIISAL